MEKQQSKVRVYNKGELSEYVSRNSWNIYSSDKDEMTLKEYSEYINTQVGNSEKELKALEDSYKLLDFYDVIVPENKSRYDYVHSIIKKKIDNWTEYKNLFRKLIEDKRNNCEHKYVYDGHDSHYDYFRCDKCGDRLKN